MDIALYDEYRQLSPIRQKLREWLFIRPIVKMFDGRVLDIGCGLGVYLEHYRNLGYGIDINQSNVDKCRSKKLMVSNQDAGYFSFDNPFDTILISHVLEHVTNPSKVLIKAWEYLNKEGKLIIVLPSFEVFYRHLNDLYGHKQYINKDYCDYYIVGKLKGKRVKSSVFPPFPIPILDNYSEERLVYEKV